MKADLFLGLYSFILAVSLGTTQNKVSPSSTWWFLEYLKMLPSPPQRWQLLTFDISFLIISPSLSLSWNNVIISQKLTAISCLGSRIK